MATLHLRTLGAFEAGVDGISAGRPSTQKARALLAFLAMRGGRVFSREHLIETFWPQADPEKARQSLKTALWSIRRVIREAGSDPDLFLQSDTTTVGFTGAAHVDAALLFAPDAQALNAMEQQQIPQGAFLEGDYDEWTVVERERIERRREDLLAVLVQRNDVRAAEDLLARDPYNAPAYRVLIDHAVASGRTSAAAALAEKFTDAMRHLGEGVPDDIARLRDAQPAPRAAFELGFAGRDVPLNLLRQHVARGGGDILLVTGTAGMGTTHLLEQLERGPNGLNALHFDVKQNDPPFSGWDAFYEALSGAPFAALRDRFEQRLPNALALAFAQALPENTILIVDDAHRLAGDALQIAAAVAQTFSHANKTVLFASRPEGLAALRSALAGLPFYEVSIGPLTPEDVRASVTEAAGRDLPECSEQLAELSNGYPLFMRAIVDEWIASGVLRYENGWRFDRSSAGGVPQSVRAIVETRLLEKSEATVQFACAFALAPQASTLQLAQASDLTEQQAFDALDDLFDAGIAVEDDRGNVRFSHDIVQETAARILRAPRRKALHRALARTFERGQHAPAQIAHHYREAGDIAEAAEWSIRATLEAARSFAFASAAAQADAGLALVKDATRPELSAKLQMWKAVALINAGDASARDLLREAADAARDCGDEKTCLEALTRLSRSSSQTMGAQETALLDEAERLARKLGDMRSYAAVQFGRFLIPFYGGDYDAAIAAARREYETATAAGDDDLVWEALSHELKTHCNYGRLAQAAELAGRLQAIAATPLQRADLHYSAAHTCLFSFRYDDVERHVEAGIAALETARRDTLAFQPRRVLLDFGLQDVRLAALSFRGELDACVQLAEELTRHPLATGTAYYRAESSINLATALSDRGTPGDLQQAHAIVERLKADADAALHVEFMLLSTETIVRAKMGDATLRDAFGGILDRFEAGLKRHPQVVLNTKVLINAARLAGAPEHEARAQQMYDEHLGYFRDGAGALWNGPEPAGRV